MLLEITSRCDRLCPDCPSAPGDAGDVDLDVLRDVVPRLRALGISSLVLTGGEPILHPRFDELLELLCRDRVQVGLRSHGFRVREYIARLAPHRERTAGITVPLHGHPARPRASASAVGDAARIVDAIEAYRAAGHAVTVDFLVTRETIGDLVAIGELLAGMSITLQLRAPIPAQTDAETQWHDIPELCSMVIAQIRALQRILSERVVLDPSIGFNHVYDFCSNFSAMDRAALRANGEVVFCSTCPAGDRTILGNLRDEPMTAILDRHPARVGAIWSARLGVIASASPAISNNCTFCRNTVLADRGRTSGTAGR